MAIGGAVSILVFALLIYFCIKQNLLVDHVDEDEKEDDLFKRCLNDEFRSEYSKGTSDHEMKRLAKRRIMKMRTNDLEKHGSLSASPYTADAARYKKGSLNSSSND